MLYNIRLTCVIDNLIPAITLPGGISGIFSGLKVFVSWNLKKKKKVTYSQLKSAYNISKSPLEEKCWILKRMHSSLNLEKLLTP